MGQSKSVQQNLQSMFYRPEIALGVSSLVSGRNDPGRLDGVFPVPRLGYRLILEGDMNTSGDATHGRTVALRISTRLP